MIRRVLATAALAGIAAALLVAGAAAADAHALVETSSPADGATVDSPPAQVSIEFSEGVRVPVGSVRVVDSDGDRVDDGEIVADGSEVTVGLRDDLPDGTYTSAFRVISADGHPIRGGLVFAIGEADPGEGVAFDDILGSGDTTWEVIAAGARFATYLATFIAAGGATFLVLVDRGEADRRRAIRLVTVAAAIGAAAALLVVVAQSALATGLGITSFTKEGVLEEVLADGLGTATAMALLGLAGVVVGVRLTGPARSVVSLTAALLATASFAATGHTRNTEPTWLAVPADAVHAVVAAIWVGGIVLLIPNLRRLTTARDAGSAARVLARFSTMAGVAVALLVVSGSVLAWGEIRAMRGLATTYGAVFATKIAIVVVVGLIAAWNRWRLLPEVEDDSEAGQRDRALRTFRRTVRAEVIGLVAILAVTSVLVSVTPARTAAGIGGVYSQTTAFGSEYSVNLVVDPNQAGQNDVHLYFFDQDGAPVVDEPFESVLMRLSYPADQIGPIEREPVLIVPGHYTLTGGELSIAGQWQIEVEARQGEFGLLTTTFQVPVNP